jgi:hypothetical protein
MIVFAVPKSMPMSRENKPQNQLRGEKANAVSLLNIIGNIEITNKP